MSRFAARRDRLRKELRKGGVDSLLVTNFINVTYLTGFTGDDSFLLITPDHEIIISDPRYTTQLQEECPGLDAHIRPPGQTMQDGCAKVFDRAKLARLGIEGESMTIGFREKLAEKFKALELVTTAGLVEKLRMIKDADELTEIRQAVAFAEKAFAVVRAGLRPEQTEKEVADAIDHQIRLFGGTGTSFNTIVAVGDQAALPHYRPNHHRIGSAPFVLIDWGAKGRLYMSDLTRVLVTAKIPPKLEKIYRVTLAAQEKAIAAIRPGLTCEEVDAVARNHIEKAGFGKYFQHGLGHSLGLEIHEAPRFGKNQKTKLEAGMVMTVEPGIYFPGFGGVRIEDDVVVTRGGCEVLTSVPKQWDDAVLV